MSALTVCPVCNGPLEPGAHTCNRCGFRLAGATQIFEPLAPEHEAPESLERVEAPLSTYSFYVTEGPQTDEEFFLEGHRITLGRDPHCDIFLNDMTVSREHAVITIDGDDITIIDDNSLNGTWVDGRVVASAKLHEGATVQIGTFTLVLMKH